MFDDRPMGSGGINLRNDVEEGTKREKAGHIVDKSSDARGKHVIPQRKVYQYSGNATLGVGGQSKRTHKPL